MALTPNFDRIVATITTADIDKFLDSSAADDEKQRVRDAGSHELRMRLVGGYLIRTNQITPARLNAVLGKSKKVSGKPTKTPRSPKQAPSAS